MPRTWSSDLQTIFQAYKVRHTLDVYLNSGDLLQLSRGYVERDTIVYNNWITSIDDLAASIEQSVDRVTVKCQNINSELGFNLASDLRLLDYAVGQYGKQYQSVRNPALIEDFPNVFPGVLANAEVDEKYFSFEFVVDYESLGNIIALRGMSPKCWWTYKNGIECTSTSALPTCPHTRAGCIERGAEKDFGGWEFFEEPTSSQPGSGGNQGGGIGGCFLGETLVWTPEGEIPIGEMSERFANGKRSIYSFDPATGEISEDEIEAVWVQTINGFFTLGFESGKINVSAPHRFLTDFGKFSPADNFRRYDTTKVLKDHQWLDSQLQTIKWNSDKTETVFNLRVKKNRTFFAHRFAVSNSKTPNDF